LAKRSRLVCLIFTLAITPFVLRAQSQGQGAKAPEQFSINANAAGDAGALASSFVIAIDRYNTDAERDTLATVLQQGGYPAFLPALRKSPVVGHITAGKQQFNIRYAYAKASATTATKDGRTIVVVTDKPVYFVGGGEANAKPREGYEVAVAQFDVDSIGLGSGTMAMAARVKPGGPAGVQIDDYADKPVKLTTVRRLIK